VGQLRVEPGASNVIPGYAQLSLDVRHSEDSTRTTACAQLHANATEIAARRGVSVAWEPVQESVSVHCSSRLSALLASAVQASGIALRALPSGAGHDAVSMSKVTDVAMLFVRCKGGISHNPAESITAEDAAVAVEVLSRFVTLLKGSDRKAAELT
jgi:allantoate deiminase